MEKKEKCKIFIEYPFQEGPWGGGNQFLKALRGQWEEQGVYADSFEEADVVVFNNVEAIMDMPRLWRLRRKYPKKIFLLRIDGPTFLIREANKWMDHRMNVANRFLVDGSIFQTEWNRARCEELGMKCVHPFVVIHNGSNTDIFSRERSTVLPQDKINIIATSWSNNWNKGFKDYQFLDERLDSSKYRFVFIGNSPVEFKNGMQLAPLSSPELAKYLQSAQIYVTASRRDPCSNSLIEAMCCGLPAVVYKDGGHPELIEEGGITYESQDELLQAVIEVSDHLEEYQQKVPINSIHQVANRYYSFAQQVYEADQTSPIRKTIGIFCSYFGIALSILERRLEKML